MVPPRGEFAYWLPLFRCVIGGLLVAAILSAGLNAGQRGHLVNSSQTGQTRFTMGNTIGSVFPRIRRELGTQSNGWEKAIIFELQVDNF